MLRPNMCTSFPWFMHLFNGSVDEAFMECNRYALANKTKYSTKQNSILYKNGKAIYIFPLAFCVIKDLYNIGMIFIYEIYFSPFIICNVKLKIHISANIYRDMEFIFDWTYKYIAESKYKYNIPIYFARLQNFRHSIIYEICMHLIIFFGVSLFFPLWTKKKSITQILILSKLNDFSRADKHQRLWTKDKTFWQSAKSLFRGDREKMMMLPVSKLTKNSFQMQM